MYDMNSLKLWNVAAPGETLAEKLNEMKLDVNDLATRTGYTAKTINELLTAKCRITPEMAINLEYALHIPAHAWLEMQKMYDEFLFRKKLHSTFKSLAGWRKHFPISELSPRRWIQNFEDTDDCISPILKFFGVASPKAWENYYYNSRLKVSFRISLAETEDPYAASVWMRRGELLADEIQMEPQNDKKLRSAVKKALPKFIELAKKYGSNKTKGRPGEIDEGMLELQKLSAELGIKILYVQNFKSAPIHGMSRWYKDIPIIQLHDRFKERKTFWFTFFHELAHIIYHGKKDIFIRNVYYGNKNQQKEDEANTFAQKCMTDAELS